MNGKLSWVLGSVIAAMFAVIIGMTNYIASGVDARLDMIDQRVSRANERLNEMDRRLAVLEFKVEGRTP